MMRNGYDKQWGTLIAVIVSIAIVGFVTGFTVPLVSLKLASANTTARMIGIMAAMPALGFLLVTAFIPFLSRYYTTKRLFSLAALGSALSILLLGITHHTAVWLFLRLTTGMCSGILLVFGEAWINHMAHDRGRGKLIAAYTTIFTVCQVMGPSLLSLLGSEGWRPFIVAALINLGAFVLIFTLPGKKVFSKQRTERRINLFYFIYQAPVIVFAVLLFSFFDNTILSLIPLYGLHYKFPEHLATLMVSIILLGDACLQLPLGWLADHYKSESRNLHLLCALLLLIFSCAMPWLMRTHFLLWPGLFLLGAVAGGIYTVALVRIGDHFTGQTLVTANAYVGLMWGIGSLLGPLIGSMAIDAMGPDGLIIMLISMDVLFLIASTQRIGIARLEY